MRKIYSNLDWEDYLVEAEYYCEDEADEEKLQQEIDDMARQMCADDWDYFYLPILERYFDHHKCIIDGVAGRWDGRYYGGTVVESAREFFDLLADCYCVEIYEDKNCIKIDGHHHDGRISMEIRELTGKGYGWYRDYSDYWAGNDALRYLFDYNFNSRKPQVDWCL